MADYPIKRFKDCQTVEECLECYRSSPPTLNSLRGAFTAFLRIAFSDPQRMNGVAPELGCLTYSDAPGESEIYIHAASVFDPGDTEQVPGIIVSMGERGVQMQKAGWDTTATRTSDFSGRTVFYIASVDVVVTCRHANADVSCMMGDYVALYLAVLEDKLRNSKGWLTDYELVGQTEPKLVSLNQESSASTWFESTVTLRLKYNYSAFAAQESKRLKDFSLTASGSTIIN